MKNRIPCTRVNIESLKIDTPLQHKESLRIWSAYNIDVIHKKVDGISIVNVRLYKK